MSDEDNPIFIPNPLLEELYSDLRSEYLDQVEHIMDLLKYEKKLFQSMSRDQFVTSFDTHIHRYQQVFLILRDLGLLKNAIAHIDMFSILLNGEYDGEKMIPIIRHHEDYMMVGFEEPPMDLSGGESDSLEVLTVGTIPLFSEDERPYNGRSVVITTLDQHTEMVLLTHDINNGTILLMWGDLLIDKLVASDDTFGDPSKLN